MTYNALDCFKENTIDNTTIVYPPKPCPTCGNLYIPSANNQGYCSKECYPSKYKKLKYTPKPCAKCGKLFIPNSPSHIHCSKECCPTYARTHYPPKPCPTCGKLFTPRTCNHKYCSKKCKPIYKPLTYRTCPTCNKPFKAVQNVSVQKYCSKECRPSYIKNKLKNTISKPKRKIERNKNNKNIFNERVIELISTSERKPDEEELKPEPDILSHTLKCLYCGEVIEFTERYGFTDENKREIKLMAVIEKRNNEVFTIHENVRGFKNFDEWIIFYGHHLMKRDENDEKSNNDVNNIVFLCFNHKKPNEKYTCHDFVELQFDELEKQGIFYDIDTKKSMILNHGFTETNIKEETINVLI